MLSSGLVVFTLHLETRTLNILNLFLLWFEYDLLLSESVLYDYEISRLEMYWVVLDLLVQGEASKNFLKVLVWP